MIINENHFVNKVYHMPGSYKLTMEKFGWGGLPEYEAYDLNIEPNLAVGSYEITDKDFHADLKKAKIEVKCISTLGE